MNNEIVQWILNTAQNMQFWYGAVAGALLMAILVLILKGICSAKSACKSITIADSEHGEFTIHTNALLTFARNLSADNDIIDVTGLRFSETRLGLVMIIEITASADANILDARNTLRDKLVTEMKNKLGIDQQITSINFEVHILKPVEQKEK